MFSLHLRFRSGGRLRCFDPPGLNPAALRTPSEFYANIDCNVKPFAFFADGDYDMKMAILSQLVDVIAEVEGLDRATVNLIARYVREGGFIATTGRGSSAAKMTPAHAANLLIAVNASLTALSASQVVSQYRALQTQAATIELWDSEVGETESISAPISSTYQTFGRAFEALIASARTSHLPIFAESFAWKVIGSREGNVLEAINRAVQSAKLRLSVSFAKPDPSVLIRIAEERSLDEYLARGAPPSIEISFRPKKRRLPSRSKTKAADRREHTMIGYPTIFAVGQLINSILPFLNGNLTDENVELV
jgi:hypothetical protein